MAVMAPVNKNVNFNAVGILSRTDKSLIEMGGFISELILKEKYPDLSKRLIDILTEARDTDENLYEKITEVRRIDRKVRTHFRKYIDEARSKNPDMSRRSDRYLEERFVEWYLEQAVRFRYGSGKSEYMRIRIYIDCVSFNREAEHILRNLEPLEYMVFMAGNGISVHCKKGFMNEMTERFCARPEYIEIMNSYLTDNVDHYIKEEEFVDLNESGICCEFVSR